MGATRTSFFFPGDKPLSGCLRENSRQGHVSTPVPRDQGIDAGIHTNGAEDRGNDVDPPSNGSREVKTALLDAVSHSLQSV
jgi:hypothetical protein